MATPLRFAPSLDPVPQSASTGVRSRLPKKAVALIWVISVAPALLMFLGVNFSSAPVHMQHSVLAALPPSEATDTVFKELSGAFTHALLEWSAVLAAFFACALCFTAWSFRRNATLPIIGVALLCAGSMDAFHTLAATRLIEASADNRQLIPFTWALARVFNIIVVAAGVIICSHSKHRTWTFQKRFALGVGVLFVGLSYATIQLCAVQPALPRTMFPEALVTRPWDAAPLVLWILVAAFLLRPFHRREASVFSHSLLIAVVPQVATELHMAFGSSRLFDAGFNVAHFLKVVGYAVPAGGLLVEYAWTLAAQKTQVTQLIEIEDQLRQEKTALCAANADLSLRNIELDEFAHVASHELQEPLRKLVAFSGLLKMDAGESLGKDATNDLNFITDAATRMSILVESILALSRSGRQEALWTEVDVGRLVHDTLMDMNFMDAKPSPRIQVSKMPVIQADAIALRQVFHNLLTNATKYSRCGDVQIQIDANQEHGFHVFSVTDNGIGIAPEYREVIFAPFKRLHGRDKYAGTGIGLAICKRSLGRMGGRIWVEAGRAGGSCFKFTIPISPREKPLESSKGSA